MKIRKIISVTIAICMAFSCIFACGVSASALSDNNIFISFDSEAIAGETVSLPVCISGNQGLMGYDISFQYDNNVLSPISVTRGNVMTDGLFEDDIDGATSTENSFRVIWSHAYPSNENGIMFYLNFNVDSHATGSTSVQISYDQSATFDGNFHDAVLNCSSKSIIIKNDAYDGNPVLTMSGDDILAGDQLNIDIAVSNIGEMQSVDLSIPYDSDNFSFTKMEVQGVIATVIESDSVLDITISRFVDRTDGKKITLVFQCESFATSAKYPFGGSYSNLSGVERVIIKGTEIDVTETALSDSIVIFTDDKISSVANQQLSVPLYIKHNTGLMGYTLTFEYDDTILEAGSASAGNAFTGSFSTNIGKESGRFSCLWFSNDNVTTNGDFIMLTFNVLSNVETSGQISISYKENDIISETKDGVKVIVPEINYIVNKVVYQIGDTNLDGIIDICDVTAIQRHIAELELLTEEQLTAADTNGDGKVDISDATYLQMYLAEYDVVLGKQTTA